MRRGAWIAALALLGAGTGCHKILLRPSFASETQVETSSFSLRTDVSPEAQRQLLEAAEGMRAELEAAWPDVRAGERGGGPERREIVAFAAPADFKKFLRSHLFAQDRAIGFYCEMGGECALAWRDPPGPEDVRVLRHELVHQHLGSAISGRMPGWLEEGIAEWAALRGGPDAGPWAEYRARRIAADAIFAALDFQAGRPSWPAERRAEPVRAVPPPAWAAGEGGYVQHLLFVLFLDAIGEGGRGAIGTCIARAARGEDAELDLSHRFDSLGQLESAYHGFVRGKARAAIAARRAGGPAGEAAGAPPPGLEDLGRSVLGGAAGAGGAGGNVKAAAPAALGAAEAPNPGADAAPSPPERAP